MRQDALKGIKEGRYERSMKGCLGTRKKQGKIVRKQEMYQGIAKGRNKGREHERMFGHKKEARREMKEEKKKEKEKDRKTGKGKEGKKK